MLRVLCPGDEFDCPYCSAEGVCCLENPAEECDDYYAMMGEE